jgi:hypothetical protein
VVYFNVLSWHLLKGLSKPEQLFPGATQKEYLPNMKQGCVRLNDYLLCFYIHRPTISLCQLHALCSVK